MAQRRQMSETDMATLTKRQAVGEAFGDFFDQNGQIVYRVPKLGLSISDLEKKWISWLPWQAVIVRLPLLRHISKYLRLELFFGHRRRFS